MAKERGDQRQRGLRGTPNQVIRDANNLVAGVIADYGRRYHETAGPLFSANDGFTPILEHVVDTLRGGREPLRRGRTRLVVEAGAGAGHQAINFARGVSRTRVLAVEPNAVETGIHVNREAALSSFREGSDIDIVAGDVTSILAGLQRGSVDAVHAHSLLHLWDKKTRARFLAAAADSLVDGGILGVTFKAEGDAQQRRATSVRRKPDAAGVWGRDPVYSNIVRLFVSNPGAIAAELAEAGFELEREPVQWRHLGYDFKNEYAHFVGFVARKVSQS